MGILAIWLLEVNQVDSGGWSIQKGFFLEVEDHFKNSPHRLLIVNPFEKQWPFGKEP